jgi:hypothetical protein
MICSAGDALRKIGRHGLERGRSPSTVLAKSFYDELDIGLRKRENRAPEKSAPCVRVRKDHQLGNEFRQDHAFTPREELAQADRATQLEVPASNRDGLLEGCGRRFDLGAAYHSAAVAGGVVETPTRRVEQELSPADT